eukprot:SAG22_NODE_62_length_23371_cov_84.500602_7_plen_61_part_00
MLSFLSNSVKRNKNTAISLRGAAAVTSVNDVAVSVDLLLASRAAAGRPESDDKGVVGPGL